MFYDSTEMEVHALAPAPDGGLYVGTSPDGRIYQASMRRARPTPFFDPDDKYIWSLAVDRDGNVFAGTGDKGTVYKITPDGKGAKFFAIEDVARRVARVRSEPASCSSAPARPAACSASTPPGKGFLLLDTTYQEIHAIRVDPKGVIYAAAQSGRAPGRRRLAHRSAGHAAAGDAVDPERLHRDHLDRRSSMSAASQSGRRHRRASGAAP